ncbi:cytochrome b [Aquibaculum arenosum]|uniref:Cytochrome b n=1 Tax=Aquibaculum arenosum TaxID=3032591 RepID=A0ABT5YM28_9PROT|nr:cytochrome b N-terminal domain-containing protein [Fodinicurvata sp. CAU 1616]MDF2095907.1 cytochrome b N-terminal domain-containing protein [Fodinicurvata sp. CAU 1616]
MSGLKTNNRAVKWLDSRLPIVSTMNHHLVDYPAPRNLNYLWNFGSLAGIVLVVMIVTGILLAMQYTPHVDHAFDSVERIMRDVNYGWLVRYIHMNGASFFFIVVYAHMLRGLYYGSYKAPREVLWGLGVIILLLMMATAFMGYVLPWGQMSFWGATVITNLFSAIPWGIGDALVTWLWGGFSVDNPTLNRFFALHYLLPFVIVAVVFLHLWALHAFGSNNPLGIDAKGPQDKIPFHPYYTVKDMFGLGVFLIIFAAFVFYAPNYMGHPDNYIEANPLVTPAHIVPEWYFLPFYAMLRAITFDISIPFTGIVLIEAKLGGVLVMFGSIILLFFLPWLDSSPVRSARFRPLYKQFFWLLVIAAVVLGYVGAMPPEQPWVTVGQIATAYYFIHFLIILPLLSKLERPKPLPASISEPVLRSGNQSTEKA